MKRLIASALFIAFYGSSCFAQNYFEDFKKMQDALSGIAYSMLLRYDLYSKPEGGKLVQTTSADYAIWGNLIYYKMKDVELLANDQYNLSVSKKHRQLTINKSDPKNAKKLIRFYEQFDSRPVLEKNATITFLGETDSVRSWNVKYKRPLRGISSITVQVNLRNYHLEKATLYYDNTFDAIYEQSPQGVSKEDKPRLDVTYTYVKRLTESDKTLFDASRIFTMDSKGNAVAVGEYKNYKISNYYNSLK